MERNDMKTITLLDNDAEGKQLHPFKIELNGIADITVYFEITDFVEHKGTDRAIFGDFEYEYSLYLKVGSKIYLEITNELTKDERTLVNSKISDRLDFWKREREGK